MGGWIFAFFPAIWKGGRWVPYMLIKGMLATAGRYLYSHVEPLGQRTGARQAARQLGNAASFL